MRKIHAKALAIFVACFVLLSAVVIAVPGAQDDPVVTLSYVENVFWNKIQQYIDERLSITHFQVVNVPAGKTVLCKEGCELILRMGSATVIATAKGGLADVSVGEDIKNAESMPSNHQLIVPVGDGRGLKALTDVIVLVKGEYSIE